MAGPGGREAGRVSIRVLPDTSLFARSLKRYLERMERTLVVRIPTELDDKGAQAQAKKLRETIEKIPAELKVNLDAERAQAELARVARDRRATIHVGVDRAQIRRVASEIASAVVSLSKITIVGGAIAAALGAATQGAVALGQALVAASGAVAALAPAAVLAAGAVGGVLVAAFVNLADSTAPAVREFHKAVDGLQAPLQRLQEAVRQDLFRGFADQVRALGQAYLPVLRARAEGVASALNRMALSFASALRERQSVADTNAGLENLRKALERASAGVAPLVRAFRDLSVVGSAFLPAMGQGFTDLAQRFADFIAEARRTGELKEFIKGGLSALSQLGEIARSVGGIFQSIFQAMEASSTNVLGIIGNVLAQVDRFLSTSTGQATLVSIFTALNEIGRALSPTILALAKAFGRLAPHFANLVEALAPALERVFTELGDALVALAPELTALLSALASGIATISPTLGPLAEAFAAIMRAVTPLIPTVANLVAIFAGALAAVLTALAPALETIASALASSLAPVLPPIAAAFQAVAEALAPIAKDLALALVAALEAMAPVLPQLVTAVADLAVSFLSLLEQITPLLPYILTLATRFFAPPMINAVTQLVTVLSDLVGGFADLLEKLPGPTEALGSFMSKVVAVGVAAGNLVTTLRKAWDDIKRKTTEIWNSVKSWISSKWDEIKTKVTNTLTSLKTSITSKWNELKNNAREAWQSFKETISRKWDELKRAVREKIRDVVALVKSLPERAVNALKGIGSALRESGRSLIGGFIEGIRSRIRDVTSAVSDVVSAARQYFPFSPAKRGPFSGKGWTLYSGEAIAEALAEGMRRKATLVESAAARLATSAYPSLQGIAGSSVAAAGAAGGDTFIFNGRNLDINESTIGPIIYAQRLRARVRRPR